MKTIIFVIKPALTVECRKVCIVNIFWHSEQEKWRGGGGGNEKF